MRPSLQGGAGAGAGAGGAGAGAAAGVGAGTGASSSSSLFSSIGASADIFSRTCSHPRSLSPSQGAPYVRDATTPRRARHVARWGGRHFFFLKKHSQTTRAHRRGS